MEQSLLYIGCLVILFALVWIPIYFLVKNHMSKDDEVLDLGGLTISELEEVRMYIETIKQRGKTEEVIPIHIRNAVPDDDVLLSKVCLSNAELYEPIMPGVFVKQAEKFLKKGLSTSYDTQIIELNHEGIGFIGHKQLSEDHIYLAALYIFRDLQGQGFGQDVMNQLIKGAENAGVKEILLLVHEDATWAKNFYLKYGFAVVDTQESIIKTYADGLLEDYYLPHTVLMRYDL